MSAQAAVARARAAVEDTTIPAAGGLRLGPLLERLISQLRDDHIRAHAGHLAFRGLFSIFAALIVTLALLAVFEARELVDTLLQRLSPAVPQAVIEALRDQILTTTMESTQRALSIGTIASIIAALYGLSATARAVIDALNTMYDVDERRPFIARFATSLVMAFAVIGLLIAALVLVAVSPAVGAELASKIGLEGPFETVWSIARWPLLIGLVLLAYALVYTHAPAVYVPFRFITHGSVTALVGWLLFSFVFSIYVDNFASFNATYGTIAGIAVLLLYMYFASFIMLIGAEINGLIQRHVQSSQDPPAPDAGRHGAARAVRSDS
ncbi:MAG TPA: YihY/virulence factor BrkB family protein [Actinomycetota bacterium]|nr:YihY/virulence factor BrkB family protein [Actinomycetota bacterium]